VIERAKTERPVQSKTNHRGPTHPCPLSMKILRLSTSRPYRAKGPRVEAASEIRITGQCTVLDC
jgi:hypothetical protein